MGKKKKRTGLIVIFLGILLPSLSILTMPDSVETSIRQHDFVLVEGSAQVTVMEGALAGKTFSGSRGRIRVPYAYIFGLGVALILSGMFMYSRGIWEARQIPQYKYYRDA